MRKKILIVVFYIVFIAFIYSSFIFAEYFYRQKNNQKLIKYCEIRNSEECKTRMFELLLPNILTYDAKVNSEKLKLIKLDASRIDAKIALEEADVLFGYGVYNSAGYEENFSEVFNKNSYAFDCGVHSFTTNHPKCFFYSECIATDKFLIYDHLFSKKMQISSGHIHSLSQKIKELDLENKKIFVKMDIGESLFEAIPELIKNQKNITGINILIDFNTAKNIIRLIPLLKELNKYFILINCNTPTLETNARYKKLNSKYYKGILNSECLYFSFINKELVDQYNIRLNQNTDNIYNKNTSVERLSYNEVIPQHNISFIVTITEKIKELVRKNEINANKKK